MLLSLFRRTGHGIECTLHSVHRPVHEVRISGLRFAKLCDELVDLLEFRLELVPHLPCDGRAHVCQKLLLALQQRLRHLREAVRHLCEGRCDGLLKALRHLLDKDAGQIVNECLLILLLCHEL